MKSISMIIPAEKDSANRMSITHDNLASDLRKFPHRVIGII